MHTKIFVYIYIYTHKYILSWCNGYCRRKWTWRQEFKSWPRLIAFSHNTNTLGKGMNQIYSPSSYG